MNGDRDEALARIHRARSITGSDEARELYAAWAQNYDDDVFGTLQVTGSARVAELLALNLAPQENTFILDAGCGTGAVGALLHGRGYRHIDGIDNSAEMLDVANRKAVYSSLLEADLNEPFTPPRDHYGAVVSAGTFVHGHVGAAGFRALAQLLRTGGLMVCAIADPVWVRGRFDLLLPELELDTLYHYLEAVLPDGAADVHMLVARRR